MHRLRSALVLLAVGVLWTPAVSAQHQPTIAQYLKPGFPSALVAARKANRIAWIAYEAGKRNVFTASAPAFRPVRLTAFLTDDGIDMTDLSISDDGAVVVFVRGSAPNADGWVANPASDPNGAERAIWAARTAGGGAWRLAEGSNPELSPDGRYVLYVKDGQIYRARVSRAAPANAIDKGEKPYIDAWGRNNNPAWSPDGRKIAFDSNRADHSFIAVYDVAAHSLSYEAPSVDRDTNPTWSPDGTRLAFLRRPGEPFGQQPTPGRSSGLPAARGRFGGGGRGTFPGARVGGVGRGATAAPGGRGRTGAPGGRGAAPASAPSGRQGGRGRGGQAPVPAGSPLANEPGLYRAAFPGGYTLSLMVADVKTGEAREAWHNAPDDRTFGAIRSIEWAGTSVVFPLTIQGDEWNRYYAIDLSASSPEPVRLTTTDGLIENAASVAVSPDGKTFYYCTNAGDIDRRHIWSVPVAGGTPVQVTTGEGIENYPVVLASGRQLAVLSADAKRPMSVGIWPAAATAAGPAAQKVIYPTLGPDFPLAEEVVPTNVTLTAEDGVEFHNQLFLPTDIRPGEKRAAMIFVHGGPRRQMLLGYHYMSFYHVFYAVNQWLVSQGYIVLSVNYRSGIGYGRSFQQAADVGRRGNAEYRDVLAAGKWLAARDDVDPQRVGIWGLSYGGLLTAEALARNSDIFKAGVDLAGVHLEGSSLDPSDVSYTSSAISEIDKWKSPVLLVQGDDDRNVNFSQMVGLVQLLRARNIYFELVIYPDDVHETLLHKRWLYTFSRMETFLDKFLGPDTAGRGGSPPGR